MIMERKGSGAQEPRKLYFVPLLKEQLKHERSSVYL